MAFDVALQLYRYGFRVHCINVNEVAQSAAVGAALGGAVSGLGKLWGWWRGAGLVSAPRKIILQDGFYSAEGSLFKFSRAYYEKLWATGRPAPFLQAEAILSSAKSVAPDRMAGFFRYATDQLEMVYNPVTKEVWHLAPIR